jgi:hypothetical protein
LPKGSTAAAIGVLHREAVHARECGLCDLAPPRQLRAYERHLQPRALAPVEPEFAGRQAVGLSFAPAVHPGEAPICQRPVEQVVVERSRPGFGPGEQRAQAEGLRRGWSERFQVGAVGLLAAGSTRGVLQHPTRDRPRHPGLVLRQQDLQHPLALLRADGGPEGRAVRLRLRLHSRPQGADVEAVVHAARVRRVAKVGARDAEAVRTDAQVHRLGGGSLA